MFNFFKKKTFSKDCLNELMERKDIFTFDTESNFIRIRGTDIFGPLNDLTFESVDNIETFKIMPGYKVGSELYFNHELYEDDIKRALEQINDRTAACEQSIKEVIEKYEYNKEFLRFPALATKGEGKQYFLFIVLRPGNLEEYLKFIEEKTAELKVNKSEDVDFYKEYKSYILKKFKDVMGVDYQYDKMIIIEPYMTWYDQNKEELEKKAHRLIENRKCHNAFDLIRLG